MKGYGIRKGDRGAIRLATGKFCYCCLPKYQKKDKNNRGHKKRARREAKAIIEETHTDCYCGADRTFENLCMNCKMYLCDIDDDWYEEEWYGDYENYEEWIEAGRSLDNMKFKKLLF